MSENIRVRSVVGRFLEHSRCFYFLNHGEDAVVSIASADWMTRNLDRRVESMTIIADPVLKKRLLGHMEDCLADESQARVLLGSDGEYTRVYPEDREVAGALHELHAKEGRQLAKHAAASEAEGVRRYRPQKAK